MKELERQEILASLEKGPPALSDALKNVTREMAVRVPGHGKWSILQCVEHVAIAEKYLLTQILAAQHTETPQINEQREAIILARGTERSRRVESPPEMLPRGRFSTLQEALQEFLAARERTIQFVRSSYNNLRAEITSHPLLGAVNCYEMILLIAAHPLRHAKQIDEIRENFN